MNYRLFMQLFSFRMLIVVGLLLCLSGSIHLLFFLLDNKQWEGPVSWRKPILFGFSTGVTALSMAWVWRHLPARWGDSTLRVILAISLLVEVVLITLQTWRGVPSHFNQDTPLDEAISTFMTLLISVATLIIALLTLYTFGSILAPRTQVAAIRWGMSLLLASCLIGAMIQSTGGSLYGKAGVLKFPHGMSIHAIQVLPLLAWLLPRGAVGAVHLAGIGYGLLTIYALVQAFGGRSRWDWTPASGVLLLLGVVSLSIPFLYAALFGRLTRPRQVPE